MKNNKKYIISVLDKLQSKKTAVGAAVSTGAVSVLSVAASAASETGGTAFVAPSIAESVNGAMFNQILTQMTDLLPILLPVVVGCLAFRKGISFLKSMIMGA